MNRRIPLGVEFYKEMKNKDYYYVDKTLLIKDILDNGTKACLFTRPRRFGKTLALSMLKTYFEDERDVNGEQIDNRFYFEGMKIMSCGEEYTQNLGKYPVINLSLKSAKQPTFEMAYRVLVDEIREEFRRHWYVHESEILFADERERFESIMSGEAKANEYATALAFLSECLKRYHGRDVIILIDEYDVPLENAYFEGFYDKMTSFVRSLFESALKTNPCLEFAVITGCLRISKESIFTGLNNLTVISVLNKEYAEYFGFTPKEVEKMLADYGLQQKAEELKYWYDGYVFGNTEVYNPWSVINYVKDNTIDKEAFPKPYWSNTSSNSIVRELIEEADAVTKKEIENLLEGGMIEKPVHEDITYGDIHESQDNLWNFLFFTGYLKKAGERFNEESSYLQMTIPNAEIRYIYRNTILNWFEKKVKSSDVLPLITAMEHGECEKIERFLSEQLMDTISFFDYAESYYHGFVTGLLKSAGRYLVISNRESGNGRPDIIVQYPSARGKAFILELKVARAFGEMEINCKNALLQAAEQNYSAQLEYEGYRDITTYGICFYRKECMVRMEQKKDK